MFLFYFILFTHLLLPVVLLLRLLLFFYLFFFRWYNSTIIITVIITIKYYCHSFYENYLFYFLILWIYTQVNITILLHFENCFLHKIIIYYLQLRPFYFFYVCRFSGYFGPDNNGTYERAESSVLTVEKLSGPLYSVTEMHSNRAALELSSEVTEVSY